MDHLKIVVSSQENITAQCRGIGFDPVLAYMEAESLAAREGKPVSYHWVDNNTADDRGVERMRVIFPRKISLNR